MSTSCSGELKILVTNISPFLTIFSILSKGNFITELLLNHGLQTLDPVFVLFEKVNASHKCIDPLPDDKILNESKLKEIADDIYYKNEMILKAYEHLNKHITRHMCILYLKKKK